jgi:hypothetical protein
VSPLVHVSLPADAPIRVTAITFDLAGYDVAVSHGGNHRSAIHVDGKVTKARIDHCRFKQGATQIWWNGWTYGVVDHCEFDDGDIAIRSLGDDNASWNRPIVTGTQDALVLEDDTFNVDNSATGESGMGCGGLGQQILLSHGARMTIRHCAFRSTCDGPEDAVVYAAGNAACGGNAPTPLDCRGTVLVEIYDNRIEWSHAYRMLNFLGGSQLVFRNTMLAPGGSQAAAMELSEADRDILPAWPGYDPINNSFYWDNTLDGAPVASGSVRLSADKDSTFIQEGRDYWLHAPSSMGGRTTWTGDPGQGETFVASGPNAYSPYAPLVYPHPRVTAPD